MKLWKRTLSLLLALVMVLGFVPLQLFATEANALSTSDPGFYRVFHLDAARKYYNLASLKRFVDMAAKNGYNQFNLYLSDNQGLRVKLNDMTVTTTAGTYDLTDCVGDGIDEGENFKPSGTDGTDSTGYLTQAELQELVTYAKGKGIEICPTINTPAHMGAILQDLKLNGASVDLRADTYGSGLAAVKLTDTESMAFVTALTKKFVDVFAAMGCKYYCIGADEYMSGYNNVSGYDNFVTYVNEVGAYIKSKGMTPRMFNDAFTDSGAYTAISKDYEIYYWAKLSPRTVPQTLAEAGYKLINMPENLYYVLRNDHTEGWWLGYPTVSRINSEFDVYKFSDSNNSWKNGWSYIEVTGETAQANVVGAAFAIWSDNGTTWTTDQVLEGTDSLSAAFALKAGATESSGGEGGEGGGSETTGPSEPTDITYEVVTGGVNITMAPGQTTKTFSIVTSEELTASSFTGGNSSVATVSVGTSVKSGGGNASGGGSAEKLTSLTAGDEIIIGDGTNFLTLNGGTLGVTQNVNEATVWTVSAGNQGSGTYYLGSNGYYLSANWDGSVFSAKNTTSPAYNENWKLSSTSLVSYVGTRYFSLSSSGVTSSTTDSGVGAYDSNASFGGGGTTPVTYTTPVTFTGVAAGNTTYTLSGTAAVDGGSDTTGYFFNITVVDSGVHVHHGGTATCISKAVCVDDGEEYGEVDSSNHVHTEIRDAKAATFEEDGYTGDTWCTDCNTKIKDGTTIPKLVAGAETITINEFASYTFTVPSATKLEPNTTGMNTAVVSSVTTEFVEEVLGDPTTKLTSLTAGQEVYVSDGTNYLVLDGDTLTTTTDESKATKWTVSVASNGKYDLTVGSKALYYASANWGAQLVIGSANGRWTFTNGNLVGGEWPNTNIVLNDGTPRFKKDGETPSAVAGAWLPATGSPASTKVTVTAGTQGTTSFLLGGTTYTVNVIPLDPTGKSVDIELFTSNTWCPLSGKQEDALNLTTLKVRENHSYILHATDAGVATAEGVTLDQIMPEFTWSSGNTGDPSHIAKLLRGTYHPAGHWQYSMQFTDGQISADYYDQDCLDLTGKRYGTSLDKTSMTELGAKEFWHIRYYATGWEVSSDGVTWTSLRDDDQVCARYLLETEVTQEVTTYVRDWANNSTNKDKWAKLDFAVKYASGDVSPSPDSYPISDKTLMYEADSSQTKLKTDENGKLMRWVDDIWGVETSDREVYMITLTRTNDNPDVKIGKTGKYTYDGQEKIVWLASAAENYNMDLPFHEDFMWGELPTEAQAGNLNVTHPGLVSVMGAENLDTIGTTYGDPLVNRVYIYEEQGMLVTYYIRAKEQGEKPQLKVNYFDESNLSSPFYNYGIVVNDGTSFSESFAMDESSETKLKGNTVVNDLGFTQTVSGVLKDMNAVPANYRTGGWTLTRVERSEDGMTVNLYYSQGATVSFVVDFGKVVNFNVSDFVENAEENGGKFVFLRTHGGSFGQVNELGTYDSATNTQTPVSYAEGVTSFNWYPLMVALGRGHITFTIEFEDGTQTSGVAYVYPATTMYYEDTAIERDDTMWSFMDGSGTWTQQGGLPSGYQETAQTGAVPSGKSQYGYDPFYAANDGPSGGTEMVTTEAGAYAKYIFMGTGTEIYANCTPDTGVVMVALYNYDYANSKTGSLVRMMMVDTAMVNGESGVTGGQAVKAYNVPVASITGLDYGYYEVRMGLVNYKGTVRKDGFHIDGFRVFNTMGTTVNNIYAQDGEANPTFLELRDTVLAKVTIPDSYDGQYADQIKEELGSSQVFTDNSVTGLILSSAQDGVTEGNIENIVDLLDNGPKNEIYLRQGESFVFKYDSADYSAQVGLKGLNGLASATVNGVSKSIPTVDLYYKVTSPDGIVTIQNTGSTILSITNVKLLPVSQTVEASEASLLMLTADNVLDILGLSDPAPSDPAPTDPEPSDPEPSDPEPSDPEPTDPALTAKDFTDVKENAWYFSAVDFAATRGLMNGVGKNTFGPEAKLTRGMLVTILYRYEGCPEVDGSVSFQDVKADKYYSDAVAWAAENGIVNGMDEKTFAPDRNITREQMVAILYRYAKYKGVDVSGKNDLKAFPDAGKISEFAEDAFAWAVDAGVIQGSDGKLLPGGTATRAQVAQVLMNFIQKVVEA